MAILVGLCSLSLYALTRPGNHSEAEDAFGYAWHVERLPASQSLHPHHLLYISVAKAARQFLTHTGMATRAYPVMVGLSMMAGSVTLALAFLLFRKRLGFSSESALFMSALIGVSYGFWRYACEAEIYILSLAPLMVAVFILTHPKAGLGHVAVGAATAAVAALVHILAAIPAVLAFPLLLAGRRRRALVLVYLLVVASTIATAYAVAGIPPFGANTQPLSSGSAAIRLDIRVLSALLSGAIGFGQSILSGNFLFCLHPFRALMTRTFPDRMMQEEVAMGETAGQAAAILPFITLFLLGVMTLLIVSGRMKDRADERDAGPHAGPQPGPTPGMRRLVLRAMLAWFALHALLLLIVEPANPEGWVMLAVPWWCSLTLLRARHSPLIPRRALGPIFVLMLLHNYFGGMHLIAARASDYNALKSRWLLDHTHAKDTILTADSPVFFRHLRYHADATVMHLHTTPLADVLSALRKTERQGGNVLITGDLFAPPSYLRSKAPRDFDQVNETAQALRESCVKVHDNTFGGVWLHRKPAQ